MQSTKEKKFQCPKEGCKKKFGTLSHLKRHQNVHSSIIFRCEKCDAILSSQYNYKRHIDNKHLKKNPKKYQCKYCEEDFNDKSWLIRHTYRHTGILPYACPFENCKSRFLVPSKLKRHLKSHEGYSCPKEDCNEKFATWTDLKSHISKGHPTVYKCPVCKQEFSRSYNLKAHAETHDTDRPVYLCPKKGCRRFYFAKRNLKTHVKHYHGKRPFNCSIEQCSKFFKSQKNLEKHMSQHSSSGRLKKKIADDLIFTQISSGEINLDDLDDQSSNQSHMDQLEEEDLDDQISNQSHMDQLEEKDPEDLISRQNPSEQLKDTATVIYLKKDDIS